MEEERDVHAEGELSLAPSPPVLSPPPLSLSLSLSRARALSHVRPQPTSIFDGATTALEQDPQYSQAAKIRLGTENGDSSEGQREGDACGGGQPPTFNPQPLPPNLKP